MLPLDTTRKYMILDVTSILWPPENQAILPREIPVHFNIKNIVSWAILVPCFDINSLHILQRHAIEILERNSNSFHLMPNSIFP